LIAIRRLAAAVAVWASAAVPAAAQAPPDAAEPDAGETSVALTNLTRAEVWRYFQPRPAEGSDPDYAFLGNRATLAIGHRERGWHARGAIQYVRLEPLPRQAIGPGALGSGGLYQFHAQSTFSYQLYLREIALGVDLPSGVRVTAGRQPYGSGAEAPVAAALADVRPRVEARLLGTFSWSLYERAFDAVRVDVARPAWHATVLAGRPTQGGYEESANLGLSGLRVFGATGSRLEAASESQAFVYGYRDTRAVNVRPDNTGRAVRAADVAVWTAGASHVQVLGRGRSQTDLVAWGAVQGGRWYEQTHRAWSVATEAGRRWLDRPAQPWVRAGLLAASGDADPADTRHGTFFPMLPSVEGQAASTVYAPMNLVDVFVQLRLRPHDRVRFSADAHWLALASAADRWYAGSGATLSRGPYFGYSSRPSGGDAGLGTMIEGTIEASLSRVSSIRAYLGHIRGGPVVRHSFNGDRLTLFWFEHRLQF
jgi:hypothetical protein